MFGIMNNIFHFCVMIKRKITKVSEYINFNTGEVIDTKINNHLYNNRKGELFFIMYETIADLFMSMEQSEIRVFGYLLRYASGMTFTLNKSERLNISSVTGLNERTIYNIVPTLINKGLLIKQENGRYLLNPEYAFKGLRDSRDKLLVKIAKGEEII